MKSYLYIFLLVILILLLQGCEEKINIISFNQSSYSLFTGESMKISINIDEKYQDKEIIYHSDNINIAKFEDGIIYGVKEGYVLISASIKDNSEIFAEALVKVRNKVYEIKYMIDEGVTNDNPVVYSKDTLPIKLKDPVRVGYTFQGWYTNDDFTGSKITILNENQSGNITLFPKWQIIESQIIYFLKGGENNDNNPNFYTYNSEIKLEAPSKKGYKFLGWYKNNDFKYKIEKIKPQTIEFLQLYAKWEIINYEITYHNVNQETNSNPSFYNILDDFNLSIPKKVGYTFEGWFLTSDYTGSAITKIGKGTIGNLDLYAKWKEIEYLINYQNEGDENNNPTSYTIIDEKILEDPIKKGYRFLGWYDNPQLKNNKITKIERGTYNNIILYGSWEIINYEITYHNVNQETNSNPSFYNILDDFNLSIPKKVGYTFEGWFLTSDYTGSAITKIEKGTIGNLDLYAKWTINTYEINYFLNGGQNDSANPQTFTIESNITLFAPQKLGYKFQGWYLDNNFENKIDQINAKINMDLNLYAKWEIITYSIEYNLNGGYWGYIDKDSMITDLLIDFYYYINPYEKIFTFINGEDGLKYEGLWYEKYIDRLYNKDFCNPNDKLPYFINQQQYYNKWISLFSHINTIIKEKNPAEDLWIDQEIGNKRIYQYITNQHFTQEQLNSIPNYSPKIMNFTIESDTIILPKPKKNNAIFDGWYVNNETGNLISQITTGSNQNFILYAKWIELDQNSNNFNK